MAGQRDRAKRANVRRFLSTEEGRRSSDTEVARQVGVGKLLVGAVRREMIAAGEHPDGPRLIPHGGPGGQVVYVPGSKARGGYVFSETGAVVTELEWVTRLAAEPKLRATVLKMLEAKRKAMGGKTMPRSGKKKSRK